MPRTVKALDGGKRYPLNMRTTKETRDRLEKAAADSGRSLAQELEFQLERVFHYDHVFENMKRSIEEIQKGNLEAELHRAGYIHRYTEYGDAWLSPGHPGERSGFIAPPEKSEE